MLKLSLSPEGRRRTTSFLALAALASASCGALPPRPKGEAPAKKALATTPLVPFEVANDEDVARAIREYYTKYEYRIPMRDGVKLHTHVYVPKDDAHVFPMMLQRTPYGVPPYGVDNGPVASNSRVLRRFAPHPAMIDASPFAVYMMP